MRGLATGASVRTLLLASVSATTLGIVLAVAASEAKAADTLPVKAAPPPPPKKGQLKLWVEGGPFWTGGEHFFTVFDGLFYGVGPRQFALRPKTGADGAAGIDYRFPDSPWHVNAQFRFGQATKSQSGAEALSITVPFGGLASESISSTATGRQKETHWLADFGVGRDLGVGRNPLQVNFGVRVADLTAKTTGQSNTIGNIVFGAPQTFNGVPVTALNFLISGLDQQRSQFLGVGPRLGLQGTAPLPGNWTFDYLGDVAVLFGRQKFSQALTATETVTPTPFVAFPPYSIGSFNSSSKTAAVFNADLQAGISYWFDPNTKLTVGYRLDAYFQTLRTMDAVGDPTQLVKVDRYFHGPRVAFSARFGEDPPPAAAGAMITKAPPPLTGMFRIWTEGGGFWTAGDPVRSFSDVGGYYVMLPVNGGTPIPFALKPKFGWDTATGFDHRLPDSPWHVSAQFRYGQSKSATASAANAFSIVGPYYAPGASLTSSNSASATDREKHWLADFAVGRDVGLGQNSVQLKAGLRIAELTAKLTTTTQSNTTILFGTPTLIGPGILVNGFVVNQSVLDQQLMTFRGAGPRIGAEGSIQLASNWTFDYLADAAVLFGTRKYQQIVNVRGSEATIPPIFVLPFGSTGFANTASFGGTVLNADAQAGISYWFNPNAKVTASYRVDAFWRALKGLTPANDPTNLGNIDRVFHGPKVTFTAYTGG